MMAGICGIAGIVKAVDLIFKYSLLIRLALFRYKSRLADYIGLLSASAEHR